MDQVVMNGANLLFPNQFGIPQTTSKNQWLLGLVTSAPYVCTYMIVRFNIVN
jgi:hypothetical protein